MSKPEDDFWNTSSHSGFNFDDEDDPITATQEDALLSSLTGESSELPIPIHAIISKNSLEIVLSDIKSTLPLKVSPVEETIKRMISEMSYNLHVYVRFKDKMDLLDQALATCDANIIIKVILYLKASLKLNIFYHQLSKRKVAIKHYAFYLMMKNQFQEMADLYMATGQTSCMKQLYYLIGQGVVNKETLHKKLDQFVLQHLQKLNSNDDKSEIHDNLQLISFQLENRFNASSVVNQFADLCKIDLLSQKGIERLQEFKKAYKIDDFTYDWTLLNVLSSMKLWPNLKDQFIKNNWLTKKKVLKTSINPEAFLYGLSQHGPPTEVFEQFVGCVSYSDKVISMAEKFKCHNFVIQYYIKERDRLALLNYKLKLLPQTPEYILLEKSLQSTDKRWKN